MDRWGKKGEGEKNTVGGKGMENRKSPVWETFGNPIKENEVNNVIGKAARSTKSAIKEGR